MSLLLYARPEETILGIVSWISIILGIVMIVKFFQIAKDVRSIKETLNEIAHHDNPKDDKEANARFQYRKNTEQPNSSQVFNPWK